MSIVLNDLHKEFAGHAVVDHISLEINDGELFVLLGPSGSGKSTILRIIAGLVPAESGRVWLHGRDVTALPPQQRNTGFVFQNYSLFRHMTVADNIEFGLAARGVPKARRAAKRDELLAIVGLAGLGQRYPKQLSGGQQQRVAVARALAFEPSVLLLDEPFGALDVKIREQLRRALKEIQSQLKVTTILVTHDQEEAFELADRIGVIERGKLLEVGTPAALYRSPQQEFVATFLGGANLLAGQVEDGRVNLGKLRLSDAVSYTTVDPEGRLEVLFRPEDLALAASPEELNMPILGQGVIEEVLFLGTLQRLRLRLQPLPGSWRLPPDYGESGVPVQVARIPRNDKHLDFVSGQQVWVGINNFHILPRVPIRLLLCIDEPSSLEPLSNFAAMLARATGGPVTALVVTPDGAETAQLFAQVQELLGAQIPNVECKQRQGRSVEEFLDEMKEGAYDIALAMDSSRKSFSLRRPLVVQQLTQRAPIPVLVVKGERTAIRRILFCTAGGEPGKRDILFGGRLARRTGAETTLLYVEPKTAPMPASPGQGTKQAIETRRPPSRWIENHLTEGALTLVNQGIRAEIKVREGPVVEEIVNEIVKGDYDLVVVGGTLSGTPSRFANLDLASAIIQRAECPVLIVRGDLNRQN